MKFKKRLIALLITVILCATTFVGCSNEDSPDTKKASSADTQSQTETTTDDDPFHITDEPIEFEFAAAMPASWGDPHEKQFHNDLAKKTNITIKWNYFPLEVKDEKVGVLLASKDLPDAFYTHNNFSLDQASTYGSQGILIDLTDLIKQYGPNIDKAYTQSDAWNILKTGDDKIYSLSTIDYSTSEQNVVHTEMFMNAKWLENVGMEVPTTTDELYKVLKAFKDNDADGNGDANNEIPLSYGPIYGYGDMLMGAFDIVNSVSHLEYDGEKYFPITNTENYKEYVKYMSKLYSEKLIDKEVFSHDNAQFNGKGTAQKLGSFIDYGGWAVVGGIDKLNDSTFIPVPVLAGPKGVRRTQNMFSPVHNACDMAVTRDCKNTEALIKWVDLFYNMDLDVALERHYGPNGVNIKINEDKTFDFLPTPEGMSYGAFRSSQTIPQGPVCITKEYNDRNNQPSETVQYKIKIDKENGYIEYATNPVNPILSFTVEETEELAILNSDIEDYIKQFEAECIAGQKDIDTNWEAHKKQLDKIDYPRLVEIYNAALSRKKT